MSNLQPLVWSFCFGEGPHGHAVSNQAGTPVVERRVPLHGQDWAAAPGQARLSTPSRRARPGLYFQLFWLAKPNFVDSTDAEDVEGIRLQALYKKLFTSCFYVSSMLPVCARHSLPWLFATTEHARIHTIAPQGNNTVFVSWGQPRDFHVIRHDVLCMEVLHRRRDPREGKLTSDESNVFTGAVNHRPCTRASVILGIIERHKSPCE
mmetsp:Transcript_51210/g.119473  ORF Transcript_51210/g.119473 Transcript_51210/m.119473 type:complete len:207 (-) Transcript_51210:1004-1624(-)